MAERQLTGKHVLAGFVAAFGVIVAVNIALAVSAVKTFPGLEVRNSYVASQTFDDRREAQQALGWMVRAHHSGNVLTLAITDAGGRPVRAAALDATVGRATHVAEDVIPEFRFDGAVYVAPVALGGGNWNIRMEARAEDRTVFRRRVVLIKE